MKTPETLAQDVTSHFIARMLYCHDSGNHAKFIELEKQILDLRLKRAKTVRILDLLKQLLGWLLGKKVEEFNVPPEDWLKYKNRIMGKA